MKTTASANNPAIAFSAAGIGLRCRSADALPGAPPDWLGVAGTSALIGLATEGNAIRLGLVWQLPPASSLAGRSANLSRTG